MVRPVESELPRMISCEHLDSYARSRARTWCLTLRRPEEAMVGVLDEEAWRAGETNKRRRWASRFVMTLARAAQDVICFWSDSRELFAPTGQRRPDLVPVLAGVRVRPREQHHVFQRRRPLPEVPFVTLLAVLVHRPPVPSYSCYLSWSSQLLWSVHRTLSPSLPASTTNRSDSPTHSTPRNVTLMASRQKPPCPSTSSKRSSSSAG